jgi:type II secretory pathway component PulM
MDAWKNLSQREKTLVGLVIPAFLLVIGYLYLWLPTQENLARLKAELPLKAAEFAWMEHELKLAESLMARKENADSVQPILTVIERRAIESQVKKSIQRVQPTDNSEVKLWFQDVTADSWLRFVEQLSVDGISVDSATISRKSDGIVNVRATFVR